MSNLNCTRNSTRVQAPPGGHSSISFGGEAPSPSKVVVPAEPDPAPAVPEQQPSPSTEEPVPEPTRVDDGPSLEMLKLQAIGAVAAASDSPEVREAITNMLKHLQVAAATKADTPEVPPVPTSVDAPTPVDTALAAFKAALKLRGTHGIISIGRKFRSMDDDGDNKLVYDEFKKALIEMKLHLSETDMMRLFRHFDADASGYVSFQELLQGLRSELSERRLEMVKRCFKVFNLSDDGKVTLADLERRYDASHHPDVVSGIKTQREVLMEFLGIFESAGGGVQGDGQVDFEEFKAYYTVVSANIDEGKNGDDYFELMMRNVWHISGGEGWCENTTCKRVLVVFEDDTQKVVEVTDDFDVDVKDNATVKAKLEQQGITNIKRVALYGDMSGAESNSMSSPRASTPLSSTPGSASRSRRNANHNQSSIVFG